ncbi:MAG: radical SAM protein [Candidatus Aminicenantes bacterium]|nr:radical SAM protein [Candidatus Aminicenantes bacterium]
MDALIARIDRALDALAGRESACDLCPRDCGADRAADAAGVCGIGRGAGLAQALLHYGEEPVLSGPEGPPGRGSGTLFFTGCNLKCLFCQNHQISWSRAGRPVSDADLAEAMLRLQADGAYNINLVSPSHVILPILRALRLARGGGLNLPLVWNSNGYEKEAVVARLSGIVDVYLPDLKYVSPRLAARYSGAADYFERASAALQEMYLQQPDLVLDSGGLAQHGMIIRHLVLPGCEEDSLAALEWIAGSLSPSVGLSLMSQYHPCHKAPPELRRGVTSEEYGRILARAETLGFESLFAQPEVFAPDEHLIPDFDRDRPFRWKAD